MQASKANTFGSFNYTDGIYILEYRLPGYHQHREDSALQPNVNPGKIMSNTPPHTNGCWMAGKISITAATVGQPSLISSISFTQLS